MRILFVNEARSGGGGVETYLAQIVRMLRSRGHDVALLYANTSRETGPTTIDAATAWSVADVGLTKSLGAVEHWSPDVVFSHNLRQLEIEEAVTARWPVVKMMHGYFGTCVSGQKATAYATVQPCARTCGPACLVRYVPLRCGSRRPDVMLFEYAWARRQRRLFDRYQMLVVASAHMRDEYARHGVPLDKLHVVPLFAPPHAPGDRTGDTHSSADVEQNCECPPSGSSGCADVLFLGRMTPLKGVNVLVDACAHAAGVLGREVRLVAAGVGPLRDRLRHAPTGVRIEWPGWVGDEARARLLARVSVIAVPSRWPEPFGLVGLEAGAAGVPAVAFDVGGISSWLRHGDNGLLVPARDGAAGFGAALATVLGNPEIRASLAAGASRTASRFTADAHADALERILAATALDRPAPAEAAR